ncbi:MAG: hypothetical protein HKM87_08175 [Ignavibacteriaceae bacterium]|nr:hypothetical protein [Ignavibacteriaceae bacterium]
MWKLSSDVIILYYNFQEVSMLRYLLFILFLTTSFPQTIDERLLLIETQKILTYIDTFEQIDTEGAEESAIASNVANSIARSMNVVMNAYHLIHIYNILQGEEDRVKVRDYLLKQLPHNSRILRIEFNIVSKYITSSKNTVIKNSTELYINSLDFVIKLLNNFS